MNRNQEEKRHRSKRRNGSRIVSVTGSAGPARELTKNRDGVQTPQSRAANEEKVYRATTLCRKEKQQKKERDRPVLPHSVRISTLREPYQHAAAKCVHT